jgi:hypothetical protein
MTSFRAHRIRGTFWCPLSLGAKQGHISIRRMPPIESAAIAVNDQMLVASLLRRAD